MHSDDTKHFCRYFRYNKRNISSAHARIYSIDVVKEIADNIKRAV